MPETYNSTECPRLLPWYVHIFGGWSLGALFPWYLTSRQFYFHGRKKLAVALMGGNILLFIMLCATAYFAEYSWDKLLSFSMAAFMILSGIAWLVQRKTFGEAPRRLYLREWKNWIPPILIAVFLGIGLSVVIGYLPLVGERIQAYQADDILARKVILWDFFRFVPYSLIFSLPVGIWWAGERQRFSASSIVGYFFGLIVSYLLFAALSSLFYFLLSRGQVEGIGSMGQVLPKLQGMKQALNFIISHDYSTYFILPLLIGTVAGIADFWKRSLAIFPLLIVSFLLTVFFSPRHWQFYQQQIFYEMTSEDATIRANAYDRAGLLLARFPDHDHWPEIAAKVADYRYSQSQYDLARNMYTEVSARTKDSSRWWRQAALAAAALGSARFGQEQTSFALAMPPQHYKSYMTGNWMALIRNLRYYDSQNKISEADTLIHLKDISKDDDKITLEPMPFLADLYNNAADLGYEVLLLPSNLANIEKLIRAGYPVIQPLGQSFYLLSGIDSGRTMVTGSNYANILEGMKLADLEGIAGKSLFDAKKDSSPTKGNQSRIDLLAKAELPFSFWQQPVQQDYAPRMAVVIPSGQLPQVATVLSMDEQEIERGSKATLTALISLSALNSGDIVQAVTWARQSYSLIENPLPLHIAHLAALLWQSRDSRIAGKLHLEKELPRLEDIDHFLAEPETQAFLQLAGKQFDSDFSSDRLDWLIRLEYQDFLDISDPEDRRKLLTIAEKNVRLQPESREDWLYLASLFEWEKDLDKTISSFQGALAADVWSNELALKLAYLSIQSRQFARADKLMAGIQPKSVKYEPDYFYCLASLADWRQDFTKAGKYYRKAIEMRRYDSRYHLDYARMLDRLGKDREISDRLKTWAARLLGSHSTGIENQTTGLVSPSANN